MFFNIMQCFEAIWSKKMSFLVLGCGTCNSVLKMTKLITKTDTFQCVILICCRVFLLDENIWHLLIPMHIFFMHEYRQWWICSSQHPCFFVLAKLSQPSLSFVVCLWDPWWLWFAITPPFQTWLFLNLFFFFYLTLVAFSSFEWQISILEKKCEIFKQ